MLQMLIGVAVVVFALLSLHYIGVLGSNLLVHYDRVSNSDLPPTWVVGSTVLISLGGILFVCWGVGAIVMHYLPVR